MTTWTAKAHQLREAQANILVEILRDIDPDQLQERNDVVYSTTEGEQLRGIPAIGRGVAGAIPGTSPQGNR